LTDSPNLSAKRLDGEPESEWQARVRRIRKETVLDVLESFGITVDDVSEMQADFQHLRRSRKLNEQAAVALRKGLIGLLFAAAAAFVTWGVSILLQVFGPHTK